MTKEKLYKEIVGGMDVSYAHKKALDDFFDSNVCIPKGVNRHPNSDVIHEWCENITVPLQYEHNGKWYTDYPFGPKTRYRIKPPESIYEWQWISLKKVTMGLTSWVDTCRWMTDNELNDLPKNTEEYVFIKVEETKRVRQ